MGFLCLWETFLILGFPSDQKAPDVQYLKDKEDEITEERRAKVCCYPSRVRCCLPAVNYHHILWFLASSNRHSLIPHLLRFLTWSNPSEQAAWQQTHIAACDSSPPSGKVKVCHLLVPGLCHRQLMLQRRLRREEPLVRVCCAWMGREGLLWGNWEMGGVGGWAEAQTPSEC